MPRFGTNNNKIVVVEARAVQKLKKLSASFALVTAFSALSSNALAGSYEFDTVTVEWDSVFTAGLQWRIQDKKKHTSEGSSGISGDLEGLGALIDNAFIINSNDGNNNFDKGLTSQRLSVLSEMDINFGNWGVFLRGKFWHNFQYTKSTDGTSDQEWAENNANPVFGNIGGHATTRGRFNPAAKEYATNGKRLLDIFVYTSFEVPILEQEMSLRFGRQVISWGEALLSGGGLATSINHVDAHIRNQPGLEIKELFLPTGAIFMQLPLNDFVAMEAYYQFEWHPVQLDPSSSYFSEFDSIGPGGNTFFFVSGTEERILGKDLLYNQNLLEQGIVDDPLLSYEDGDAWNEQLDPLLEFLPTACNENSTQTERNKCLVLVSKKAYEDKAGQQGQYGVAFNFFLESGDELGLYYVKYHEKIPSFILPLDSINTFGPVLDLLAYAFDPDHYAQTLGQKGGFSGIEDLSATLSLPQLNGILLFLSALSDAVDSNVGQVAYDLVRDPTKLFGDNVSPLNQAIADNPLLAAAATTASYIGADLFLKQFGLSTKSKVRNIDYRLQYFDGTEMIGFTYSTVLGVANVATEVTYRDNMPVMTGDVARTPVRSRVWHWHLNTLLVLEPAELWGMKLWDFSTFTAEMVTWYIPGFGEFDVENYSQDNLAVQNTPKGVGVSAFWSLEYQNVFTGWDIVIPVYVNWGIDGAMFQTGYRDGQVIAATGLTFRHLSGMEISAGVTKFFGDQDDIFQMLTQDRDNATLSFKYGF